MAKALSSGSAESGPAATTDIEVSHARDSFLSGTSERGPYVRRAILASWERSRDNNVGADRILAPFIRDPDLETPLARGASPILDVLHEQLRGEEVGTILTDQSGLVLDRRVSSLQISKALDTVQLAPGFSYAEKFVGTNGIGTAISSGSPAFVDGSEHYAGQLGQFACAGTPIRHPIHGKVIGILDITTWRQTPGPMLIALASSTARQIEAELRAQTGIRELALVHEYMKTCQRSPGPVLALNNDVVMMNDALRHLVDPAEQQTLIGYAVDTMRADNRHALRTVELPSGRTAHLSYSPASTGSGPAGGVFRIRLERHPVPLVGGASLHRTQRINPPGLAGTGPAWTRSVQQTAACFATGDWFAVEGEMGAGKLALLRAVHQQHEPGRHFRVTRPPATEGDSWLETLAEDLTTPGATVVLRHAERLSDHQATATANLLTDRTWDAARVVIALRASEAVAPLRSVFPRTVEVPALRHHIDDLPDLVHHLLRQLTKDDQLTCSPQALAQLARLDWPGNVSQLRGVLATTIKHRSRGVIDVADLPPECRSAGHRLLTPIEALERDAIVNALRDNQENPTRAAKAIGMSRATIYRKIRQYGIS
ncbi:Fis family transcriptional regulator [Actinoplanes sp. ATCC 53533]|uniref:sigma-54-dependent Fis family transcriptional regulator n=1 Tax=Actinoplanes sp. ATCC 53533 TaxID=1288362 RepID=UPI000F7B9413|nr:GAF domain-containing protein [Actinoplanes sp. ATCC 53533]RSM45616.1 Fis family transcriptional regulator [Actinoplanes sp. ATCC 53533]